MIEKKRTTTASGWSTWFFCTIAGSFIPCWVRFYMVVTGDSVNTFDIKDVMFACLAILISNFTLINSSRTLGGRNIIINLTWFLLVGIISWMNTFIRQENNPNYHPSNLFELLIYLFTIIAVTTSYFANSLIASEKIKSS